MKKIHISVFCFRRNQQKSGLREEPEASKNPGTHLQTLYHQRACQGKPRSSKEQTRISLRGQQLLIITSNLLVLPRIAPKSGGISHLQLLPGALLSFLREGNVSISTCKELLLCLQRWSVQKFWKMLFTKKLLSNTTEKHSKYTINHVKPILKTAFLVTVKQIH